VAFGYWGNHRFRCSLDIACHSSVATLAMNWLAFLLMWTKFLTWSDEGLEALTKADINIVPGPCDYAAWYDGALNICSDSFVWMILHESQHHLAYQNGPWDFDKFERVAMQVLRRGDYSKDEILNAKSYVAYGGGLELHAQLPWIVRGNIPPCLGAWYPWFDLKEKHGLYMPTD